MNVGVPPDYIEVNRHVFKYVLAATEWTRMRFDVYVYKNKWNDIQFACESDDGHWYVSPAVSEWLKTERVP